MTGDPLLDSLRSAVETAPADLPLRLHLAEMLANAGHRDEAVHHAAVVLQVDPANAGALSVISGIAPPAAAPPAPRATPPNVGAPPAPTPGPAATPATQAQIPAPPAPLQDVTPSEEEDLANLGAQLEGLLPAFLEQGAGQAPEVMFGAEDTGIRLADVGGMTEVKARLEAAFLAPLRNPELVKLYGATLRGGLLLYGPPGCGKTFIARALAGEMGAKFLSVSLAEVLDMYVGQSERNVHELFEEARRAAPCVVFLDEVDALGQKRTQLRNSAARGAVNQLLTELDGIGSPNDGVYTLGATNQPWDVDVALMRPGRFDRLILVLPPDEEARSAIFRYHLASRPVENIDLGKLARKTDGYSGADIAFICDSAAQRALLESARTGEVRAIQMDDLAGAIADVRPSVGPWLDTARNVAQFANQSGAYDELHAYLRRRRLL